MKKNIILSYLVGLLASLFAVSVQGQNVVMTDDLTQLYENMHILLSGGGT